MDLYDPFALIIFSTCLVYHYPNYPYFVFQLLELLITVIGNPRFAKVNLWLQSYNNLFPLISLPCSYILI